MKWKGKHMRKNNYFISNGWRISRERKKIAKCAISISTPKHKSIFIVAIRINDFQIPNRMGLQCEKTKVDSTFNSRIPFNSTGMTMTREKSACSIQFNTIQSNKISRLSDGLRVYVCMCILPGTVSLWGYHNHSQIVFIVRLQCAEKRPQRTKFNGKSKQQYVNQVWLKCKRALERRPHFQMPSLYFMTRININKAL